VRGLLHPQIGHPTEVAVREMCDTSFLAHHVLSMMVQTLARRQKLGLGVALLLGSAAVVFLGPELFEPNGSYLSSQSLSLHPEVNKSFVIHVNLLRGFALEPIKERFDEERPQDDDRDPFQEGYAYLGRAFGVVEDMHHQHETEDGESDTEVQDDQIRNQRDKHLLALR